MESKASALGAFSSKAEGVKGGFCHRLGLNDCWWGFAGRIAHVSIDARCGGSRNLIVL